MCSHDEWKKMPRNESECNREKGLESMSILWRILLRIYQPVCCLSWLRLDIPAVTTPVIQRSPVPNRDEAVKPTWWNLYKDAILETDQGQVPNRIRTAEDAIRVRASLDGQVSSEERVEIQQAMAGLLILRRELGQSRDDKMKRQRDAYESK
jgi:hypothetical protein